MLAALLFRVLSRVPLRWLHAAGILVGWCLFQLSSKYARRMRQNLTVSGIARDPADFRRLLRACVGQNGKSLTELPVVWFGDGDAVAKLVAECRGWEEVEALRRRGRSIIFLSPHMGCFEIAARYVSYRFPLTVMYRPQRAAWLNALMENGRTRGQLALAPTSVKGVRMLLEALRSGQSIGLLPDHAPRFGEGVWADFFAKPAYTMTLPRRLQRGSDAALMLTFAERLPHGQGFRLHFEPVPEQNFDEEKMNRAIENLVRRYPDQYHWQYNRYKRASGRRERRMDIQTSE